MTHHAHHTHHDDNNVFILPSQLVPTAQWSMPVKATQADALAEGGAGHAADPLASCRTHPETMQWVRRELFRPNQKLWRCTRRDTPEPDAGTEHQEQEEVSRKGAQPK